MSAETTQTPLDLRGVAHEDVDSLVPNAGPLLEYADALVTDQDAALDTARIALVDELGAPAAVRAAAVVANFDMMNRLVDGAGAPIAAGLAAIAADLDVEYPPA